MGSVLLDGLNFAAVGHTPAAMGEGHWSVAWSLYVRHAALLPAS